ncbi:sugar phosphate nucleotidyltransferase [Thermanaerosceptrum fracticalcis]
MWPLKKNGLRLLQAPLTVKNFVEKPDIFTAVKLLAEGNYFWNSGMLLKSLHITEFYHPISLYKHNDEYAKINLKKLW